MPIPLPASTDVIIRTANPPIITLFTVRCTQNVETAFTKMTHAMEEAGERQPLIEDELYIRQTFKVTGDLVSTAGTTPEAGDDDLVAQYHQFKRALEYPAELFLDDAFSGLLQINIHTPDGVIVETGHFMSGSITFVQGEIVTARVNFDFLVGRKYWRIW